MPGRWWKRRQLYQRYIKEREETLLDAAASAASIQALFLADEVDYSQITPQMEEAFHLAYPDMDIGQLSGRDPEQLQGVLNGWKGKYFEVLVRDRLNDGEWAGDIHLELGQKAVLAVFDSPVEELVEDVISFLPFIIIAVGEGRRVLLGKSSFQQALERGLERALKGGIAISVGAVVYLLDGGFLSLPVSFLARLGFDRWKLAEVVSRRLDRDRAYFRWIADSARLNRC